MPNNEVFACVSALFRVSVIVCGTGFGQVYDSWVLGPIGLGRDPFYCSGVGYVRLCRVYVLRFRLRVLGPGVRAEG